MSDDQIANLNATLAGRYRIERAIGAGGMAAVFLARDLRHDRLVAIKVMNPELGAMLGAERFLAEIRVTANLQHPNLLPLFDSGEAGGLLYYVMPFIAGESLGARLAREKQLPVDEAVRIAKAVASAVDYAHRNGVIHRDLKPENILLNEGQPVVADFGIARAVSSAGGSRITSTGLSLGTPQYMAPEQAAGDRDIDGRADIYSLGAVLYEMLTAEPPHTASTAQAIIARVLVDAPRPVRESRPSVPEGVAWAVHHALEKVPGDRFGTAAEFAEALDKQEQFSRAPTELMRDAAPRRRARDPLLLAVGAVAVIATAFAAWSVTRRAGDAPRAAVHLTIPVAPNQLMGFAGTRTIALSPDGRTVVFSTADSTGRDQLYSRSLDSVNVHNIPGTIGGITPAFSPDGKYVAFMAAQSLQKIATAGGTPTALGEIAGFPMGISWGSAGTLLVSINGVLGRVAEAGGGKVELLAAPDSALEAWPMFLPDGKRALYGHQGGKGATFNIAAIDLATGKRTVFNDLEGSTPLAVLDHRLVYGRPDGTLLAVPFDEGALRVTGAPTVVLTGVHTSMSPGHVKAAVSASGSLAYLPGIAPVRLELVDATRRLAPLDVPSNAFANPRYSPDGKHIAMSVYKDGRFDIWVYDVASRALTRLTTEGTLNQRPEWSPDGKRVIYRSDRGGGPTKLWWQPFDGSAPAETLMAMPGQFVMEGVITPDGRTLAYRTGGFRQSKMWYRALTGDSAAHAIGSSSGDESSPRLSPDGRWIAYQSDASGSFEVYVRPFPGPGARVQVSAKGGHAPVWSHDGRHLYYTIGQQLIDATLTGGASMAVASSSVFYEGMFIWDTGHPDFDVAPDGRSLLILRPVNGDLPITMVHDWKYELR